MNQPPIKEPHWKQRRESRFKPNQSATVKVLGKATGLPPGPIGNPGRLALEAAMHPATSDYYFFVSDGNGHHRFARNLSEHNRNVVAFRRTVALRR